MSRQNLSNIETFVLLAWFIEDFDSKFLRYRFTGDFSLISKIIASAGRGRNILFRLNSHVQEISKILCIDIMSEGVPSQPVPAGPWVTIHFLSFGVEAGEFVESFAVQFICKFLKENMKIRIPELRFKVFYLPPLPVATTEAGHHMSTINGFTSTRNRRIEINIRPPVDCENIYKSIVHEILHVCILDKSNIDEAQEVESKVEELSGIFLTKSQKQYDSERNRITESIQNLMNTKLLVLYKANTLLDKWANDITQASLIINDFLVFFDAILDEKIKAIPL